MVGKVRNFFSDDDDDDEEEEFMLSFLSVAGVLSPLAIHRTHISLPAEMMRRTPTSLLQICGGIAANRRASLALTNLVLVPYHRNGAAAATAVGGNASNELQ